MKKEIKVDNIDTTFCHILYINISILILSLKLSFLFIFVDPLTNINKLIMETLNK